MYRMLNSTALFGLMFFASGCAVFTRSNERITEVRSITAEHVENGTVYVDTRNGSVEVVADDAAEEVTIEARVTSAASSEVDAARRLAETRIDVVRDNAGQLTIRPVWPDNRPRGGEGASFNIRVPGARSLTISTSNGAVKLRSMNARLFIKTTNGAVEMYDHSGDAVAETSNGFIAVLNHKGPLQLKTSNGAITVVRHKGSLKADTSNGSVEASVIGEHSGPIVLNTSNGGVKLSAGPTFGGTVLFQTRNGAISIDDEAGLVTSRVIEKAAGRIILKNAGGTSVLETSNADITVEFRDEDEGEFFD